MSVDFKVLVMPVLRAGCAAEALAVAADDHRTTSGKSFRGPVRGRRAPRGPFSRVLPFQTEGANETKPAAIGTAAPFDAAD